MAAPQAATAVGFDSPAMSRFRRGVVIVLILFRLAGSDPGPGNSRFRT
jgi:hypothetical protein